MNRAVLQTMLRELLTVHTWAEIGVLSIFAIAILTIFG